MSEPEEPPPACGMPEFLLNLAWWGLWLAAGVWIVHRAANRS